MGNVEVGRRLLGRNDKLVKEVLQTFIKMTGICFQSFPDITSIEVLPWLIQK